MNKYLAVLIGLWLIVLNVGRADAFCLCNCSVDCMPMGGGAQVDYFTDPAAVVQLEKNVALMTSVKDKLGSTLNLQDVVAHLGKKGLALAGSQINKGLGKIAGKKVTSASRLIEESKKVDLNSEADVQKAFVELFLQHPSGKQKTNDEYEKIGEQFKIDTTLEMYIIAREMEKEIEQKLQQIDKIESCITMGEDCDAAGFDESENCENSKEEEDGLCLWRADLMVARLYDQIMWYNEFLLAMDAQYNAVMSIGTAVKIRENEEEKTEEEQTSALEIFPQMQNAESMTQWQMAFADNEWFEGTSEDRKIQTQNGFDVMDRAGGFESSLSGKEESFASLESLNEAQTAAQNAIRAHNVKSQLDSFRNMYVTYHETERYRNKIREHLALAEECIRNYVGQYYTDAFHSWVGADCSLYQDKMYCPYGANDVTGLGLYDIDCPNNPSQRCYVTELTDITMRSGLSGYLLALYDESKKQAASGEIDAYLEDDGDATNNKSADRYVTMREDSSREARKMRQNNPIVSMANSNQQSGDYAIKNPNDQDAMIDEIRAAEKLNWMSGSLVSQAMVRDINGKQGGKFGTVKHRYPLWNDQKEFYDQYIDGKYENIRAYIENLPLEKLIITAARVVNQNMSYPAKYKVPETGEWVDEKVYEADAINMLEADINNVPQDGTIDALLAEEKARLQQLLQDHENKKAALKRKIVAAGNRIEQLNTILDTNNKEFNKQDEKMDSAEQAASKNEAGIHAEEEMYALRAEKTQDKQHVDISQSPMRAKMQQEISENDDNILQAEQRKEELNLDVSSIKKEIAELEANIEEYKQQIDAEIKAHVKQYSDTVIEYRNKINEVEQSAQNSNINGLIEEAAGNVKAVALIRNAVNCVRHKILQKIDAAIEKLHDMRASSEIYYADNTAAIQNIHNEMIQSILDMKTKIFSTPGEGCSGDMAENILAEISKYKFVEAFLDMCVDDYCTTPEPNDENGAVYFVSMNGKARDFRAPTGPLDFASAPLREIFYFDGVDFDNIEKYYEDDEPSDSRKITITAEGFLNSGADIPEIWKQILKNRPFVERGIDLEKLLNRGNPELAFSRSGTYPCKYNGKIADAAVNKDNIPYLFGYNLNAGTENVIQQKCLLLKNQNGKVINTETGYAEIMGAPESAKQVSQSSELGQILAYVPEYASPIQLMFLHIEPPYKLSFNQAFLSAVHAQDNFGDEDSEEMMEQYKFGMRSMFTHNQFGDYLNFIEKDKEAEENMLEAKKQLVEIHQQLKEIFNEFGDTISDDLDLADEDDYDMAAAALDGYKNAYMRKALESLIKVRKMITVEAIQEKADDIQRQIELLKLDDDEMVQIGGSETNAEVEYNIKQNLANKEISDAYDKRAHEEMDKQISQMQKPYCAVYAK